METVETNEVQRLRELAGFGVKFRPVFEASVLFVAATLEHEAHMMSCEVCKHTNCETSVMLLSVLDVQKNYLITQTKKVYDEGVR